jgi:hypothetical protein
MNYLTQLQATGFIHSAVTYQRYDETGERRLVIPVQPVGDVWTEAILDTGSSYCIFKPQSVAMLQLENHPELILNDLILLIRGELYWGHTYQLALLLGVETGIELNIECQIFVLQQVIKDGKPYPVDSSPLPINILGWDGFLDVIRLAIDPKESMLYLGLTDLSPLNGVR